MAWLKDCKNLSFLSYVERNMHVFVETRLFQIKKRKGQWLGLYKKKI